MGYPSLGDWNQKQPNEIEPAAVAIAEGLAWSAIETLTAGRVAFEPVTIRPMTVQNDGTIYLPPPVHGVVEVRIAGALVSPADWRLDEPSSLVALNGSTWQADTDITSLSTDVDVLEVTYFNGWRPGKLLVWAAAELAAEFYRAASGDKKCRLPKNVTAITRQGVSFEMSAPLFSGGRTGIHEIDVVLARYNPYGVSSRPVVATPESLAATRRLTSSGSFGYGSGGFGQ